MAWKEIFCSSCGDETPEMEWLSLYLKSQRGKNSGLIVSLVCWITEPPVILGASKRGTGFLQIGYLCAFQFVHDIHLSLSMSLKKAKDENGGTEDGSPPPAAAIGSTSN